MNLVQLKYFQAVCTYQSVSAAADALYISQPSLSSAIKELEREFGVALFRRHHWGMVLTPEGRELLKLSEGLLGHAEQVKRIMNDLGDKRKSLRLGVPPMIGALLLPHLYQEFSPLHPDVRLDITEAGRQELLNRLSEDLLDMVFLPHNTPFDSSLASHEVAQLEIVCCATKNSPIAAYEAVSPSDLADIPIVLFKNSFFQTEEIKKWFSAAGGVPNILLQTDQLSTLQNLISSTVAIGFLFRQLIEPDSGLMPIPMRAPLHVRVSLVWKKNACFFHCMQAFLSHMRTANPFVRFS